MRATPNAQPAIKGRINRPHHIKRPQLPPRHPNALSFLSSPTPITFRINIHGQNLMTLRSEWPTCVPSRISPLLARMSIEPSIGSTGPSKTQTLPTAIGDLRQPLHGNSSTTLYADLRRI